MYKGTFSLLGKCKTALNEVFYMPAIICYESDTAFDNVCISYSILYVMKIILQMMNSHCLGAMTPRSPSLYPPEFKLKLTKLNETSHQEMESRRIYGYSCAEESAKEIETKLQVNRVRDPISVMVLIATTFHLNFS